MLTKNISILLQVCLLVVVCLIYLFSIESFYNSTQLYVLLLCNSLATLVFVCTIDEYNIRTIYYRPILIFLLGYFIVYFQRYIDLAFGLINESDPVFIKPNLIIRSLAMSSIGYISLFIGYLQYYQKKQKLNNYNSFLIDTYFIKRFFYFSFILFFIFKSSELLTGNYSQEDLERSAGGLSNYSGILFVVSYFSLLSICVYNSKVKGITNVRVFLDEFGISSLLIALVVIVLYFISGGRTQPILILCSFLFAVCFLIRLKISFVKLFIVVVAGSIFLSFIGATRNIESNSIHDKMRAFNLKTNASKTILPSTLELSGSLSTYLHAIDYVPVSHDYLYGSFHFRNLLSAIPFSSRLTSKFLDPQKKYHSSDFFITYIIQGEHYSYGNGTSLNADLYLNYGFCGILFGMFLLGRLIRYIEFSSFMQKMPSLTVVLFLMYLAGYALVYVRNGFLAPINYIAFSLILNYYCKTHCRLPLKM